MRKSLFIAALCALATLGMVSCKPKTTVVDVKVEVTPNTLTLGVGESSEKLAVKITPAGNNQTIVWSSSDEAVATVKSGIVTGVAVGTATITATVGNASGTCVVTVTNDAAIENFVIGGWGLFGYPEYIPGTEGYIHYTNGDSAYAQLAYYTLYVWDNNLTYVSGKGFSGTGFLCSAGKIPVYILLEGEEKGYYVGNSKGYFIDTITAGYTYEPYVAQRGELVDENKYGDFFSQYVASLNDTTLKVDNKLYDEALTGAKLYILYADKEQMSYYMGNMKYANLRTVTDPETKEKTLKYKAIVEWFDFYSPDRYFGLKANFNEKGAPLSIVTPYDMRTVVKEYTNIEATEEVAEGYVVGDMSHFHAEVPVIYENTLQKTMNLYRK